MSEIDFSARIISANFLNFRVNPSEPASRELTRVLRQMTSDSSISKVDSEGFKALVGTQLLSFAVQSEIDSANSEGKLGGPNISLNELKMQSGYYVLFFQPGKVLSSLELKIKGKPYLVNKQRFFIGRTDVATGVFPDLDLTDLLGDYALKVSRQLLLFNESNGDWSVKLHPEAQTSVFVGSVQLTRDVSQTIQSGDKIHLGNSPEKAYLAIDTRIFVEDGHALDQTNFSAQIIADKFHVFRIDGAAAAPEAFSRTLKEMIRASAIGEADISKYRALIAYQLLSSELSLEKLTKRDVHHNDGATIVHSQMKSHTNFYVLFVKPATVSTRLTLRIGNESHMINSQDYLVGRRDEARNILPNLDLTTMLRGYALKVSRQLLIFREVDAEWRVKLHPNAQTTVFLDGARMKPDFEETIRDGVAINIGNSAENPYLMIRVIHEQF